MVSEFHHSFTTGVVLNIRIPTGSQFVHSFVQAASLSAWLPTDTEHTNIEMGVTQRKVVDTLKIQAHYIICVSS